MPTYLAQCAHTQVELKLLLLLLVISEAIVEHMTLISKITVKGRHTVVIMDGVGWHQKHTTEGLDNVSIIKLPLYSPELNTIEQVWQWMGQNELANRCFNGYDDIIDECCRAWSNFRSDKLRVKKYALEIGLDWSIN